MANILIYTDGASRGNPGRSASGFNILQNKVSIKSDVVDNKVTTNNIAEHIAIYAALKWCIENINQPENTQIKLYSDSELAIKQINGVYKIKDPALKKIANKSLLLTRSFKSIKFYNVRRENKEIAFVDRMLNIYLDSLE